MTASCTFSSFRRLSMAVTIAALAAACGGGGGDGGSAPAPAPIPITDPLQPLLTGPGDPQNYVPTGGFDSWTYNSATSAMGTTQYELASVSIAGNKTVLGVSTITGTPSVAGCLSSSVNAARPSPPAPIVW